jgi:hypothetical protein
MHRLLSIMLCALALLLTTVARAQKPADTVRSFFGALGRHDFRGALGLTAGSASVVLGGVLNAAEEQAARAHAALEVEVRDLRLIEGATDAAGRTPIEVRYDVDVFGKRSFFRSLVRHVAGSSQFIVADGRIASVGTFAP